MFIVLWLCAFIGVFIRPSQAASSDCETPPLDITIVIDRTKSVGKANYEKMLDTIKSLIEEYDVGEDKTHISIVTYAGDAEIRVSLDDPNYYSKEALKELLDEMKEKDKLGSPTRTDKALKLVGEEVFTEKNGDRPESPNIMMVFTDGNTHKSSEPYDETIIPELEKKGVHRIAVGIGRNIAESELETIAGDKDRVVNAKNFDDLKNQLDDIREKTCNIDGGYTEWTEWTECTATCGGGTKRRSRKCTNPSPKNKGKTCIEQEQLGPPEESKECNTDECPVPGGYTDWSSWGECSVTCGGGVQTRTRTCTNPPPSGGGPNCIEQNLGPAQDEQECNTQDCAVPGGYTDWSSWGECSVTCGGGVQTRTRTCTNPPPSGGGPNCVDQNLGPAEQPQECNKKECPVPGGYTDWSSWGECSVTCGGGVQTRTRTCTNPPPSGGGPNCMEQNLGLAEEEKECNTQDCGEDGNWSPWGNPGPCDKTCGGGTRTRQRTCTNPPPSGDGEDCKGSSTNSEPCNTQPCPTPEPPPPKPCKEILDVGVIIDSSNSISRDDYEIARQYIRTLAERLEISEAGSHMAILLYSFEAHTWHRFTDTQSIDEVIPKAESLPHIGGGTRTDRALQLAAEDFFGWEDSGDRPDKPNVLIVLTDGNTNEGSKPFDEVIPPLDEAGVRRIAIGIGSGINLGELEQIASKNEDVLQVKIYGQLHSKLEEIMKMACEEQYPGDCDNWEDYGDCSKTCGGGVQVRTRECPENSLHLKQQKKHCNTNLCPGQQPCNDNEEDCPLKAAKGDCWKTAEPSSIIEKLCDPDRTFPLWVTCKKSCRRCNVDTSCQDDDPYMCPWWSKARGNPHKCNYLCRYGWKSLSDICKKSCNQCSSGGGGGGGGGGEGGGGGGGQGGGGGYGGGGRPGYGGGGHPGYGGGGRPGYGGGDRPGYGGGGRPGYGGGGRPGYGGGGRPGYGGGGRPGYGGGGSPGYGGGGRPGYGGGGRPGYGGGGRPGYGRGRR